MRRRYRGHSNSGMMILNGLALLVQFRDVLLIAMFLLSLLLIVFCIYRRLQGNKWLQSVDMSVVDKMDGTEFEVFVASILRKCGYTSVKVTKKSGDYGADILARDIVFQCKRYDRPVGVKAVQEAHAAKSFYRRSQAIVITNSTFTAPARELAVGTGTTLWERRELVDLIYKATSPKMISPLCRRKTY